MPNSHGPAFQQVNSKRTAHQANVPPAPTRPPAGTLNSRILQPPATTNWQPWRHHASQVYAQPESEDNAKEQDQGQAGLSQVSNMQLAATPTEPG